MATSEEETTNTAPPITLEDLKLQLYHPPPSQSPMFQENSSNSSFCQQSLSFIPWKLVPVGQDLSTTGPSSSSQATSTNPLSLPLSPSSVSSSVVSLFPKEDYLDLRRQQNLAWAENRLVQGNEHYYLDATKADEVYQEGLKLCPDHVPLLVAQAKLWIFRRNRPQAAKTQLEHCLHLDPHHSDAKDLLERWHRIDASRKQAHHHHYSSPSASSKALPQMRETSSAFQNALMERNLAMNSSTMVGLEGDDDDEEVGQEEEKNYKKNDDDTDQDSNQHYSSHKKKKKRKSKKKSKHNKKHDKKKKRRKRKRHDSSSDEDDDDGNDDDSICKDGSDRSSVDDRNERRRRDRHSRHHKQKRRENRSDSSPEDSSANSNGHGISKLKNDDGKDKHSPESLS